MLLTYKALKGLAPVYLSELLIPYSPPRLLCSQDAGYLKIPRISRITMGGRAFSYRAPQASSGFRHTLSLNAGSRRIYLANSIAKWSTVLEMVGRRNSAFKNLHETGGPEHASMVPVGFVTTLVTWEVGEVRVLLPLWA